MGVRKVTTTADAKAAAYTALAAAVAALDVPPGDRPVQVAYGFPGEANLGVEAIFLGAIQNDNDWASIGDGGREENYTIQLVINVMRNGWTQQRCTERASELLKVCDNALTSSSTVQLLPPPARTLVAFGRLTDRPGDAAREAEIVAGLRVFARL